MENLFALTQISKLSIMIAAGFALSKAGQLSRQADRGVSIIVIYLAWPCLIISSFQREFSLEVLRNMGAVALAISLSVGFGFICAVGVGKALKGRMDDFYLFAFMVMFGNTGFMGIPVSTALFGAEGTFYAAIADASSDILIFTFGVVLIAKSKDSKTKWSYKNLIEPATISIALGLIFLVLGISLPDVLLSPLTTIGNMTIPLSMIGIGSMLAKADFKELVGDYRLYLMSLLRLVVIPGAVALIIYLFFGSLSVFMKVIISL